MDVHSAISPRRGGRTRPRAEPGGEEPLPSRLALPPHPARACRRESTLPSRGGTRRRAAAPPRSASRTRPSPRGEGRGVALPPHPGPLRGLGPPIAGRDEASRCRPAAVGFADSALPSRGGTRRRAAAPPRSASPTRPSPRGEGGGVALPPHRGPLRGLGPPLAGGEERWRCRPPPVGFADSALPSRGGRLAVADALGGESVMVAGVAVGLQELRPLGLAAVEGVAVDVAADAGDAAGRGVLPHEPLAVRVAL